MRVVLPAPEEPTSAVRMPGRKAPEQPRSSCSIFWPSHSPRRAFNAGSSSMPCTSGRKAHQTSSAEETELSIHEWLKQP